MKTPKTEIRELNLIKFGKFENYKIDLTSGLNVIYGKNEAGKSTIQLFIKAMLYGLPSRKKSGELLKDRDRIIPFDSTRAEGSMKLCISGREIEIHRVFGRTAAGDKAEVCDSITGKVLTEYNKENIGDMLLGISCNIFEKTLWIKQGAMPVYGGDEELSDRLMNIKSSGDEGVSGEAALKKLAEKKRLLKARDGRSAKGRIDLLIEKREDCRRRKYDLVTRLAQTEKINERLAAASDERKIAESEIAKLEIEYKKSLEAQKSVVARERLCRIDECNQKIAEAKVCGENEKNKRKEELSEKQNRTSAHIGASIAILAVCFVLTVIFAFILPVAAVFTAVAMIVAAVFMFYGFKASSKYKAEKAELDAEVENEIKNKNETIKNLEQAILVYLGDDSYEELKKAAEAYENTGVSVEQIEDTLREERRHLMNVVSEIKELESRMAYQVKIDELPADIDTELNAIEVEIKECERRLAVIDAAESAIREASEKFRQNFAPAINTKVGEIIGRITADKYETTRVAEDFRIRVDNNSKLTDAEYLSYGTYEQMYFAFRIAAATLVCDGLPLFLDDILTTYDNERAAETVAFLKDMSEERQVVLFTCHLSDMETAKAKGADTINLNR